MSKKGSRKGLDTRSLKVGTRVNVRGDRSGWIGPGIDQPGRGVIVLKGKLAGGQAYYHVEMDNGQSGFVSPKQVTPIQKEN